MSALAFVVGQDGAVRFLHSEAGAALLAEVGETVSVERASHVEWERGSGWYADLAPVGGPKVTGFDTRDAALRYESDWLLAHGVPKPLNAAQTPAL